MVYSSQDILFIVAAFCILWLTIFISWVLYYLIRILRDACRSWSDARRALESVNQFFKHTSGRMSLIAQAIAAGVSLLNMRKSRPAKKKSRQDEE